MRTLRSSLRSAARQLGYDIVKAPRPGVRAAYEGVRPHATYAPWNLDAEFLRVFDGVEGHTLVDIYRCFELWRLVEQVGKLAPGGILEVGVWRGGTGALLAYKAQLEGFRERVYLCDTFTGVVKAGAQDPTYRGGEHADTDRGIVESLVSGLGLRNVEILQGIFPEETGAAAAHETFRLCHVDVDVYQSARDVVDWVWPRLVPGGVVVFDDYGFAGCTGISRYVDEQLRAADRTVLHNLNGHALLIKHG